MFSIGDGSVGFEHLFMKNKLSNALCKIRGVFDYFLSIRRHKLLRKTTEYGPSMKFFYVSIAIIFLSACAPEKMILFKVSESDVASKSTESMFLDLEDQQDLLDAEKNKLTRSQVLVRGGLKYLHEGKFKKASDVFNAALTFDVNNGLIHFLNAFSYHQIFLEGGSDYFDMAELGYNVSVQKEPMLSGLSYRQLGHLYMDARQYAEAMYYLQKAIDSGQSSQDLMYEYYRASIFNENSEKSAFALGELRRTGWNNPLLVRAEALHSAARGDRPLAVMFAKKYADYSNNKEDLAYLEFRISQIENILVHKENSSVNNQVNPSGIFLAQTTQSENSDSKTPTFSSEEITPQRQPLRPDLEVRDRVSQDRAADADSSNSPGSSEGSEQGQVSNKTISKTSQITKNWYRCDPDTKISDSINLTGSSESSITDENTLAPSLPQTCPGENPKTAVIEVTMVESLEAETSASGVNIMDGLNAILAFSGSRVITNSVLSKNRTRSWVLANGTSQANLSYSLNIANAGTNRARLLARPSMTVIDRVPSVFFSGATITLGVTPAGELSSPTIVDKSVGVSLAVTTTFVDDDNVLVSLRATSAVINTSGVVVSSSLLQQNRNSMRASALMKFDQTLVINGLRGNAQRDLSSGVPLLQDIPLLQYLFKKSSSSIATTNFIAFLTLRRSFPVGQDLKIGSYDVLESPLREFIIFDERDLKPITESIKEKTDRISRQLRNLIYF